MIGLLGTGVTHLQGGVIVIGLVVLIALKVLALILGRS